MPGRVVRDLRFLLAILNWAAKSRDEQGQLLLESNPLRGLKTPTEKNPTRVLLTELEYEALLEVSLEMDWRFRVALVIAHEMGHRIGAIGSFDGRTLTLKVASSGGVGNMRRPGTNTGPR